MSGYEDFMAFYRGELRPVVRKLEAQRRALLAKTLIGWMITAMVFLVVVAWSGMHIGYVLIALGTGAVIHAHFLSGYRVKFKQSVIGPLVERFDANLEYRHDDGVQLGDFNRSNLFREPVVTDYKAEDLVIGSIGDTQIRFSEVEAKHVKERGRNRSTTLVFKGLYFVADFNKYFSGETYVLPDTAERLLGNFGKTLQSMSSQYGELVKLEDPEFERWFVTYSSSQIEARYILSSALMARITRFRLRHQRNIHFAFVRDTLYIALDLGRDLFEPRFFDTIDDPKLFEEFWRDLRFFTGIVEALALDTRIWTRA